MSAGIMDTGYVRFLAARVGQYFEVDADAVVSNSRVGRLPEVRWVIWSHLYNREGWSMERIGAAFGRDHGTVSKGLVSLGQLLASADDAADLQSLIDRLPTRSEWTAFGEAHGKRPDELYEQIAQGLVAAAAGLQALARIDREQAEAARLAVGRRTR